MRPARHQQHHQASVALGANHQLAGVLDSICGQGSLAGEIDVEQSHRRVLARLSKQRARPTRAHGLELGLVGLRLRGQQCSRIGEAQCRECARGHAGACQHRSPAKASLACGLRARPVLLGNSQVRLCARGTPLVNFARGGFQSIAADSLRRRNAAEHGWLLVASHWHLQIPV